MDNPFNLKEVRQRLTITKRVLPVKLANQAERHFTEAFDKGGLDEFKWKEVKRRIQGEGAYKYPKKKGLSRRTKPILVMTGELRRKVSRSIISNTWQSIHLQVKDLDYAARHNEGLNGMPARPFMKQTRILGNMQKQLIDQQMKEIWGQ
jgi:phage gpG-like protein